MHDRRGVRPLATTGDDAANPARRVRGRTALAVLLVAALAALAPTAASAQAARSAGGARLARVGRGGRRTLAIPVASAGADQQVASLATVTLDGSSSGGDGGVVSLAWSQTAGPSVVLSDPSAAAPTFVAPVGPQTLTFRLTATEDLLSSVDQVTVTVAPLADHYTDAEFVTVQYQDFLGRPPTDAELQAKVDQLAAGATTRLQLVEDLLADPAFTQPLEGAVQAYEAAFGRLPDSSGLRWWVAHRRQGASVASLTDGLMRSHEYATHEGTLTDEQYVATLYQNLLGRPADPAGLAYWTRKVAEPQAELSTRRLCSSPSRPCTPCSRPSMATYHSRECEGRRRERRRRAALMMAYSGQGVAHLGPIAMIEHADVVLLHTVPSLQFVVEELNGAAANPHDALAQLLASAQYGTAHGW